MYFVKRTNSKWMVTMTSSLSTNLCWPVNSYEYKCNIITTVKFKIWWLNMIVLTAIWFCQLFDSVFKTLSLTSIISLHVYLPLLLFLLLQLQLHTVKLVFDTISIHIILSVVVRLVKVQLANDLVSMNWLPTVRTCGGSVQPPLQTPMKW